MLLNFGFDQRDLARGNLAQSRDDFLVIRFDQRAGALEQLFGPARGPEDEFESIRNLFETIFYSYTGHCYLIFRPCVAIVNEARAESKAELLLGGQSVGGPFGV
jgi:hypothetical protein